MKICIVHNRVAADEGPDAVDVLTQVEAVAATLAGLGHDVSCLGCTLDLENVRMELAAIQPHLVFNLVESLAGYGSLIHLFPALLEALQLPYTGSGSETVRLTSNKTAAKEAMRNGGLPTPAWFGPYPGAKDLIVDDSSVSNRTWIIKSLWEHASVGLDVSSIVDVDSAAALIKVMAQRTSSLGGACFAEEYIAGREFNLSLLARDTGPIVLPPAEICFAGFDRSKPQIVDYRAKWIEDSFEYQNTPRNFDFDGDDAPLLAELANIARACWHAFNLRGYARVDFRVDRDNQPWILEINANPCLSPDAGFAAALARGGLSFNDAVQAVIVDAGRSW